MGSVRSIRCWTTEINITLTVNIKRYIQKIPIVFVPFTIFEIITLIVNIGQRQEMLFQHITFEIKHY